MLSRSLIRSFSKCLARPQAHALPRTALLPSRSQPFHFPPQGLRWSTPKRLTPLPRLSRAYNNGQKYSRFNPEAARRAKPIITPEAISNLFRSQQTKWVVILASGSAIVFYVSNLETVPVSGRRRFNCYSEQSVEEEGQRMYHTIMQEATGSILPEWDPRTRMVQRVMNRLIPASGLEHVNWEVNVIHSNEMNAFVIPGGKVFVYSGILPIAKDDDGLAAIIGHEIAHNLAQHAAEGMSSLILLSPIRYLLIFLDSTGYTMGLGRVLGDFALDLGITRPAGRKQESEADYIGLMMMARSCYDPKAAVGVWQRMQAAEKQAVPEWLSTHPSNANRIEKMQSWLPIAEQARMESDCGATMGYSQDFKSTLRSLGGFGGFYRS